MRKIIFVIIAISLFGCGENNINSPYGEIKIERDNNTTSSKIDLFPTDLHKFWIYESYQLDEKNQPVANLFSIDSVVVEEQLNKLGKKAYRFATYNHNGNKYRKIRDDYYFVENNQVWTLATWLNQFTSTAQLNLLPLSDTTLIKILDTEDDLWRIYRIKLQDETIPNLPFGNMSGKVDILCSWEGISNVKTKIATYQADEYLTTISINLQLDVPFVGKQNIIIEREYYRYFVKNIGLVKSKLTSSSISFPMLGEIPLNGFEKTLIYFK